MSLRVREYPRHWWFSCNTFTCYVQTDENDLVTDKSAPIVKKFVGQHVKKLVGWIKRKHGGFMYDEFDKTGRPF